MSAAPVVRDAAAEALWNRFKMATAAQHRRVERTFPILEPTLTRADYRFWLARLHGFYGPLEAVLEPWAPEMAIDWPARRKALHLQADLGHLGLSAEAIAALPHCAALPAVGDLAAAFGVTYVLEGATLGGRLIARQLSARLGVAAGAGADFFSAYGDEVDARWLAFRLRLAAAVAAPALEARAIDAACDTFDALGNWLHAGLTG
ncbi:biliverdin-producing heme oxygenase [Methylolobus aquaticus]